jgi:hypothetical protein
VQDAGAPLTQAPAVGKSPLVEQLPINGTSPTNDGGWRVAQATLQAAADVLQHERALMLSNAPPQYAAVLRRLYSAVTGHGKSGELSSAERRRALNEAKAGLEPALALYRTTDDERTWLQEQIDRPLAAVDNSLSFEDARARVRSAVRIGQHALIEPADDTHPHEQGEQLHEQLQTLIPVVGQINEQVIRLKHDGIHHEAEALMEGHAHGKKLGPGALVELQAVLWLVDGFLLLTDEELAHHLGEVHGVLNGVSTYSELVKAVAELTGGAVTITASYAASIAKLAGDTSTAAIATGLARSTGLLVANVIAGIEVVHGIAVLLDPHATAQQKVDGAVGASSGAAWLVGARVWGAAAGFSASSALMLGYAELKLMANLYWGANVGLTAGLMRLAYETIQRDGENIARAANDLAKAGLLRQDEKDPEKAEALRRVETSLVAQLGAAVDYFIDDCKPRGVEDGAGLARYPGGYDILREVFAPVAKHKGAKTPETVTEAARVALERITWSLAHAGELITASARRRGLGDVEHDLARDHEGHE